MTTTVRIDPHVHSQASYDGRDPVDLLLEQAADIGLDAVAVTDHNVIEASLRAADLAPEYGLVAIPGVEVSTADGHLLALGVEELPEPGRPLVETVATVRDRGGLAVVAHPFQVLRHGARRRHIGDADAVEVFNSLAVAGLQNRRAHRFAAMRGYPMVGGSDAHAAAMVGRTYTEVRVDTDVGSPADLDVDAVLDAVRDGATAVRGTRTPLSHYVAKFATNVEYRTKTAIEAGAAEARATAAVAARSLADLTGLDPDAGGGGLEGFDDPTAE